MMINRLLSKLILDNFGKGKAIIILGSRQVGKSTLLKHISEIKKEKVLFLNCDDINIKKSLEKQNFTDLQRIIGNNEMVIIDEAQRVRDIGLTLKIIIDQFSLKQLLVSGSSAFELSNTLNEPLTGRKFEYQLYPFSLKELVDHFGYLTEKSNLKYRLIFGMYPDVVNNQGNEIEVLKNLTNSYLFKDVFSYQGIRKPEFIESLLEALALQMGSEVSYNELSQLLGSNPHTIQNYISILERAFIVFRLRSFSRNSRNEIKKSRKIYFHDNGIRNAILSNYNDFDLRSDQGALWENFVISERMKYLHYNKLYSKSYFWRTAQQQEIDYLEEYNGKLLAFEIKWNTKEKVKFPHAFTSNYHDTRLLTINPDNIWDFVGV
jgi:predicted AAA+ superfamily ATPase